MKQPIRDSIFRQVDNVTIHSLGDRTLDDAVSRETWKSSVNPKGVYEVSMEVEDVVREVIRWEVCSSVEVEIMRKTI